MSWASDPGYPGTETARFSECSSKHLRAALAGEEQALAKRDASRLPLRAGARRIALAATGLRSLATCMGVLQCVRVGHAQGVDIDDVVLVLDAIEAVRETKHRHQQPATSNQQPAPATMLAAHMLHGHTCWHTPWAPPRPAKVSRKSHAARPSAQPGPASRVAQLWSRACRAAMLQVTAAPRRAEEAAAAALEAAAMLQSAATGPFGRNSLSLVLDSANLRPVPCDCGPQRLWVLPSGCRRGARRRRGLGALPACLTRVPCDACAGPGPTPPLLFPPSCWCGPTLLFLAVADSSWGAPTCEYSQGELPRAGSEQSRRFTRT